MAFHEVRFPISLSYGSAGGPERRTEVVTLANGYEERNSPWAHSRRRYDAGLGMRSLDDIAALIAFFEARQGMLFGFRWKDWADFKSCMPSELPGATDQVIGEGDGVGASYALAKAYRSSDQTYMRPIAKPVAGTVRVALNGTEMPLTEYEVDPTTGVVTLAVPPDTGSTITAGFEFDVPVRFDTDHIQTSAASFRVGEVPNVPIVEVRV